MQTLQTRTQHIPHTKALITMLDHLLIQKIKLFGEDIAKYPTLVAIKWWHGLPYDECDVVQILQLVFLLWLSYIVYHSSMLALSQYVKKLLFAVLSPTIDVWWLWRGMCCLHLCSKVHLWLFYVLFFPLSMFIKDKEIIHSLPYFLSELTKFNNHQFCSN